MGLFTAMGAQDLGLLASLGGFTSLYAMDRSLRQQLRILPLIALALVASAAIGEWCAGSMVQTLVGAVLVAGVATLLTFGYRLGPPGPVMFVLVALLTVHVAGAISDRNIELPPGGIATLVAAGAVLATAVSLLTTYLVQRWWPGQTEARDEALVMNVDPVVRDAVGRIMTGVLLAVLAGHWLLAYRPHWVVITTMAILQGALDRQFTLVRAIQRVLGTVLGIALFEVVLLAEPSGLGMVALIMGLQFGIEVVIRRNYVLGLLFITPLALTIATFGQQTNALLTITGRLQDTLLGAGVAMTVLAAVLIARRWQRPAATH